MAGGKHGDVRGCFCKLRVSCLHWPPTWCATHPCGADITFSKFLNKTVQLQPRLEGAAHVKGRSLPISISWSKSPEELIVRDNGGGVFSSRETPSRYLLEVVFKKREILGSSGEPLIRVRGKSSPCRLLLCQADRSVLMRSPCAGAALDAPL
jgi:hypothetical protein